MNNINLNLGGVIGAVLMLIVVMVTVVFISSEDSIGGRIGGLGVPALFLGAFGGNYLWDKFISKKK
jgi:hypothetical protein